MYVKFYVKTDFVYEIQRIVAHESIRETFYEYITRVLYHYHL